MARRRWEFLMTFRELPQTLRELQEAFGVHFVGVTSWPRSSRIPGEVVNWDDVDRLRQYRIIYIREDDGPLPKANEQSGVIERAPGWISFELPKERGGSLFVSAIAINTGQKHGPRGENQDYEQYYRRIRRFFGKKANLPVYTVAPKLEKVFTTSFKCTEDARRFHADGGRLVPAVSLAGYFSPDPPSKWGPPIPPPKARD